MRYSFICIISVLPLFIQSCKDDEKQCVAGTGGSLTLAAFPAHHGKAIISYPNYPDTVFVKFNTQDSPGTDSSDYDAFFVGEDNEEHVHLTGLKCGDYFLYSVGFDSTILERVSGGIPFTTQQETGELHVDIPVTE